ncbi:hypothetical protein ACMFMG_012161 [Clarireedia jacksonii]
MTASHHFSNHSSFSSVTESVLAKSPPLIASLVVHCSQRLPIPVAISPFPLSICSHRYGGLLNELCDSDRSRGDVCQSEGMAVGRGFRVGGSLLSMIIWLMKNGFLLPIFGMERGSGELNGVSGTSLGVWVSATSCRVRCCFLSGLKYGFGLGLTSMLLKICRFCGL